MEACHDLQGCCFVCTLMNTRERSAAQARDLPASWALSLSNQSWTPHRLGLCQLGEGSGMPD